MKKVPFGFVKLYFGISKQVFISVDGQEFKRKILLHLSLQQTQKN